MGRPESQLSGDDPRLLAFASDLRRLRRAAGSPSYRGLAKLAHYSPSALSQAANGRSVPSLEVTLGFVRACGGDVAEWESRWHELGVRGGERETHGERGGAAETPDSERECDLASGDLLEQSPPPRHIGPRRLRTGLLVLAAVAACALAITGLTMRSGSGNGSHPVTSQTQRLLGQANPVADGSDPNRAGCGPDAVTMAVVRVHFPAGQLSGELDLRYSPRCRAAWGRFEPANGWKPGSGTMVTVWTVRPADQATQSYSVEFGGEAIIGNLLMTARGCVLAEVTMVRSSTRSPVAATACIVIK